MNKEMLNTLDDLSKKPTTELALQVMELTADNMVKDKEIERLNNIIEEVKEHIENINNKKIIDLNWELEELLKILDKEV